MEKIFRSAIKSVDVAASPEKVDDFVSNLLNWPQFAIVNLRSVTPGNDGWFDAVTRFGRGQLRMLPVKELGIFDHIWKDPQASWRVFARVVQNGEGSTVMMTLFQPPVMTDAQFDQAMRDMDVEMNKLKEIMER